MNLGVIIHTWDGYEYLWEGWNYCFQKYWDTKIKAQVYFANENKPTNFPHVKSLPCGKGPWGQRLLTAMNKIPEDHVLYIQEDFWFSRKLHKGKLEKWYEDYLKFGMEALKIMGQHLARYRAYRDGKVPYRRFKRSSAFLSCHCPQVINKAFFQSIIEPQESPWDNETGANKKIRAREEAPRIYYVGFRWGHGVNLNALRVRKGARRKDKGKIIGYGAEVMQKLRRR
jgi:hypothetical protein